MGTIRARYEVTTPLFCGGADNAATAELRLPSFKGVLRFWWRALAWSRLGGNLERIKREEDALFGSASGGQARVLMRLEDVAKVPMIPRGQPLEYRSGGSRSRVVGEGVRYLGYGLMEAFGSKKKETKLTRPCLVGSGGRPLRFTVVIRYRDRGNHVPNEEQIRSLQDALRMMGLLGGMGSRSRRGFGSLVLEELTVDDQRAWTAPATLAELQSQIEKLLPASFPGTLPPYTAFSAGTRCVLLVGRGSEPLDILDLVGKEFLRYRGWGHNGTVLGEPSEKNFKDDHDLMKGMRAGIDHPRRVAFGLPHNYGNDKKQHVGPGAKDLDRRASPVFFHVHRCGDKVVAIVSFLPAIFLPGQQPRVLMGGTEVPQEPENELYKVVHAFLDRLKDPARRKEPFTGAPEVTP